MVQAPRAAAAMLTAAAACGFVAFPIAERAVAAQEQAQTAQGQPRVNTDAALSVEFTKRVQEYVDLRKKAAGQLPRLSKETTPEEIDKHQRALAQAVEQMRPNAKPGEIFTREVRAYFRRQLERVFAGPEGRKLEATVMDENPGPIRLRVNGRYPDTVPLATMPPQVLAALPKLPDELEYRFIGHRLILLDVPAHLVADFIEDALPR
jgi:hypothetical protein